MEHTNTQGMEEKIVNGINPDGVAQEGGTVCLACVGRKQGRAEIVKGLREIFLDHKEQLARGLAELEEAKKRKRACERRVVELKASLLTAGSIFAAEQSWARDMEKEAEL